MCFNLTNLYLVPFNTGKEQQKRETPSIFLSRMLEKNQMETNCLIYLKDQSSVTALVLSLFINNFSCYSCPNQRNKRRLSSPLNVANENSVFVVHKFFNPTPHFPFCYGKVMWDTNNGENWQMQLYGIFLLILSLHWTW